LALSWVKESMRKQVILFLVLTALAWSCDDQPEFEPVIQPVQLDQTFWVQQGESVRLESENLIISNIQLEGWHARGFVGPRSTARMTIDDEEISISHFLKCEYEFVGKETFCERDDAFFDRLDDASQNQSQPETGNFWEVAHLENGLKIYMLFIETDPERSEGDFVEVKSAELIIRKD